MEENKKEQPFNLKCENFKRQLINVINESGLPISSIYYIYQLVGQDIERTYYGTINTESLECAEIVEQKIEETK
jgi:hypothetical protein